MRFVESVLLRPSSNQARPKVEDISLKYMTINQLVEGEKPAAAKSQRIQHLRLSKQVQKYLITSLRFLNTFHEVEIVRVHPKILYESTQQLLVLQNLQDTLETPELLGSILELYIAEKKLNDSLRASVTSTDEFIVYLGDQETIRPTKKKDFVRRDIESFVKSSLGFNSA